MGGLLLTLMGGCKPREEAGASAVKTVDFAGDGGVLSFFIATGADGNEMVYRYFCPGDRDGLDSREEIRKHCELRMPQVLGGPDGFGMKEFDLAITGLYLQKVNNDGGKLNSFELRLKGQLYKCLKAEQSCDPLENVRRHNVVVAGHFQSYMMGFLQEVFDGAAAAKTPQVPDAKDDPKVEGLQLAGVTDLSQPIKFRIPILRQQVAVEIPVGPSAQAVNVLSFTLSAGCKARLNGLASVVADGQLLTGPSQLVPTTGGSFLIRKGPEGGGNPPGLKLSNVQVVVRRNGTGVINCTITLRGEKIGDDDNDPDDPPPPPPPPQQCTEAKRLQVMQAFATRPRQRHWHFLWHGIRNSWDEMSQAERSEIITRLGNQWSRTPANDDMGEEFLHMHQVMLGMVKDALKAGGCEMYPGWTAPPGPNDPNFRTFDANIPSGGIAQMNQWHQTAGDETRLRQVTLGRYGTWVEGTLHNNWHMRHADPSKPTPAFNQLDLFTLPEAESHSLNRPQQDWLGHPYSSHVNPYFWRLHGYVDEKAYAWLRANQYDGFENGPMVQDHTKTCKTQGAIRCYTWRRTWSGLTGAQPAGALAASAPPAAAVPHHEVSEGEIRGFRDLSKEIQRLVAFNANMFPVEFELGDEPQQATPE